MVLARAAAHAERQGRPRGAAGARGGAAGAAEAYVAPRTPIEEVLAGIWAEVLRRRARRRARQLLRARRALAAGHAGRRAAARRRFGVELPLRALFEAPTVAGARRAQVEAAAAPERGSRRRRSCRVPRDAAAAAVVRAAAALVPRPARAGQRRLQHPAAPCASAARSTSSALRAELCARSSRRHEALRTTLPERRRRGRVQVIAAALDARAAGRRPAPARRRGARGARRGAAPRRRARPFDLARGPAPARRAAAPRPSDEHVLLVDDAPHRLRRLVDGRAGRELGALYAAFATGAPSPLPELPIQYADFAVWQRELARGRRARRAARLLEDAARRRAAALDAADRPAAARVADAPRRPGASAPAGRRALAALRGAGRARRAYAVHDAAGGVPDAAASRYTGQDDIVVGTPIASRTRAEIEGLIGFFVNTLVLRADLAGDPTFARAAGAGARGAPRRLRPPGRAVRAAGRGAASPERDPSRTPLFQVMFVLQERREPAPARRAWAWTRRRVDGGHGQTTFDLTLGREEAAGSRVGSSTTPTSSTRRPSQRMPGAFPAAARGDCDNPERQLVASSLLPRPGAAPMAPARGSYARRQPEDRSIPDLFAAQAAHPPGAIALGLRGGGDRPTGSSTVGPIGSPDTWRRARRGPRGAVGRSSVRRRWSPASSDSQGGGGLRPPRPHLSRNASRSCSKDSGARVPLDPADPGRLVTSGVETVSLDSLRGPPRRATTRALRRGAAPGNVAYVIDHVRLHRPVPKVVHGPAPQRRPPSLARTGTPRIGAGPPRPPGSPSPASSSTSPSWRFLDPDPRLQGRLIQGDEAAARPWCCARAGTARERPLQSSASSTSPPMKGGTPTTRTGCSWKRRSSPSSRPRLRRPYGPPSAISTPLAGCTRTPRSSSAAIAAVTERVAHPGGQRRPPAPHHPVCVAEEWSLVDNLSKAGAWASPSPPGGTPTTSFLPRTTTPRARTSCSRASVPPQALAGRDHLAPGAPAGRPMRRRFQRFPRRDGARRRPPASRAGHRPGLRRPRHRPDVLAFDRRQKGMFHSKSFEQYAATRVIPARINRAKKLMAAHAAAALPHRAAIWRAGRGAWWRSGRWRATTAPATWASCR